MMDSAITSVLRKLVSPKTTPPLLYIHNGKELELISLSGIYKKASCFFVSNGPSLKLVDLDLLGQPGLLTWGINNGPKTFRPDIWCCVDPPEKFLESILRDSRMLKFLSTGKEKDPIWDHANWKKSGTLTRDCPNVIFYKLNDHFHADRYFTEPDFNFGNNKEYGGGRSVMLASLKLMFVLGIRRVYLIGVDFHMTAEHGYHFEQERWPSSVKGNNSSYGRMFSNFTQLAPFAKLHSFEIFNCTPGSSLTLFPWMPLEEAIKIETGKLPDPLTEKSAGMYSKDKGVHPNEELVDKKDD